jgi:hypothetical protein
MDFLPVDIVVAVDSLSGGRSVHVGRLSQNMLERGTEMPISRSHDRDATHHNITH